MMPYFDSLPLIQNSKFNSIFRYVDSYAKIFLILYPPLENSTTRIAITHIHNVLSDVVGFRRKPAFLDNGQ